MGLHEYLNTLRQEAEASVASEKTASESKPAVDGDRKVVVDSLMQKIAGLDDAKLKQLADLLAEEKASAATKPEAAETPDDEKVANDYFAAGQLIGLGIVSVVPALAGEQKK